MLNTAGELLNKACRRTYGVIRRITQHHIDTDPCDHVSQSSREGRTSVAALAAALEEIQWLRETVAEQAAVIRPPRLAAWLVHVS